MRASRLDTLERVHLENVQELHDWLVAHHRTSPGAWVVTWRRPTGRPRPDYPEIVDELVAFGWIDGKLMQLDEERSALLVTPRNPKSEWARSNRERVARLIRDGRMQPAGMELVTIAQRTGLWDSLAEVENLVEPPDLATALDADAVARAAWDGLRPSAKQQHLYQLHTAKQVATRKRRIERIMDAVRKPE